ncbi:MAG: hypothetical protein HXS51_07990 [Theionarchaea archaeon]|nr:hypothetical protein [Theionarchaea archaeon]
MSLWIVLEKDGEVIEMETDFDWKKKRKNIRTLQYSTWIIREPCARIVLPSIAVANLFPSDIGYKHICRTADWKHK